MPTFFVPSDERRAAGMYMDEELTAGSRLAKGNYAAYGSPFTAELQMGFGSLHRHRPDNHCVEFSMVLARQCVFSEVRTIDDATDERGAWTLPWKAQAYCHLTCIMKQDPPVLRRYVAEAPSPINRNGPIISDPMRTCCKLCRDVADFQFEGMPCIECRGNRIGR